MKRIYLDYNSTTPLDPRVLEAMMPYLTSEFGNPSSQTHTYGWSADSAVQIARKKVADLIGAHPQDVIFTSGATESNNLVINGFIDKLKDNPKWKTQIPEVITSRLEHSCVRESLKNLETRGQILLKYAEHDEYGIVSRKAIEKQLTENTALVSLIWGNNEIGSLNPILEIADICHRNQVAVHTDATQACGKIPVNVADSTIDFLAFSGHKIYGPKGVGVLYLRKSSSLAKLNPLFRGGGQECNLRSGTLNVPAIVGMGKACEIAKAELETEYFRLSRMRDFFLQKISNFFPEVHLNGHPFKRLPHHLSLTFPQIRIDQLLPRMQNLALSSTSACASGAGKGSPVLAAMGISFQDQISTLRVGIGRMTQEEDLIIALEILQKHINPEQNKEVIQ